MKIALAKVSIKLILLNYDIINSLDFDSRFTNKPYQYNLTFLFASLH